MNKRRISLALVVLLLIAVAFPVAATSSEKIATTWYAYVRTSNGKGLNLRSGPSTDYPPIATIPYGGKVFLNDNIDRTWVEVDYGRYHGYVMGRYLSYDYPSPNPQPAPTAQPADSSTSLEQIFRNFVFTSYPVLVRPSTPGGFVHMRWAPTKASAPILDYHQNDVLNVISQNETWAQVVDPNTGITGFMMRSFLINFSVGQAKLDGD